MPENPSTLILGAPDVSGAEARRGPAVGSMDYRPEPTCAEFHGCDDPVRGIMGPRGSGKSVACCMEIMHRALRQEPYHGIRRSRWAAIRATYPMLLTTTIKTWCEWVDPKHAPIKYSVPITCKLQAPLEDGTQLDLEVLFLALDHSEDVGKLKSLELTGGWINEASEIDKAVLDMLQLSIGRYPPKIRGGPTWTGVIMDTNPPGTDHWYYNAAEVVKPRGWRFFRQPPALLRLPDGTYEANVGQGAVPAAENVSNQSRGYDYWASAVPGKDQDWINVFILGEYGNIFTGKPVYEGLYSEARHVSKEPLGLYRGQPLYLGFDFGLTPACVFGQISPKGQLRILREYLCDNGGIRQFVLSQIKPALANEFKGMPIISTGDPAGAQRSQVDEMTCMGELARLGIPTQPALTNEFTRRRDGVIGYLTRMLGDDPAFIIDPSCIQLRRAMGGGYQFARVRSVMDGTERYHDQPLKNEWSHIAESLQYLCLRLEQTTVGAQMMGKARPEVASWGGI